MPNYYKVNLKDKQGNIIYPNIHPLIDVSETARITGIRGITLNNSNGQWINAVTSTRVIATNQQNENSFWPIIQTKTAGGHTVVLGGINNQYGFYGYYNGRTENATDWQHRIDVSSGAFYNSGAVSFGSTLTVTGKSTFNDTATFNNKVTFPTASTWYYDGNYGIDMNNNDIINANTIYFNDQCDASREGFRFMRSGGTTWDTLNVLDGAVYIYPNIALDATSTTKSRLVMSGNTVSITGDVSGSGTIDASGNVSISTNCSSMFNLMKQTVIDLRSSSYNVNTWYPVVSGAMDLNVGMHHLKCVRPLQGSSVVPSWSTHSSGFSVNCEIYVTPSGWGNLGNYSYIPVWETRFHTGDAPVGYSQLTNSSRNVFWLRGGGRYYLYSGENLSWQICTASTEFNAQGVAPTTSYPGVSVTDSTMQVIASRTGDSSCTIEARNGNEVNFGGSGEASSIYFGFRKGKGNKPVPTSFVFGGASSVYTDITAGLIYSSKNGNTLTMGSQNGSYCHIYNSKDIPFYFNRTVYVRNGYYAVGSANASVQNLYAMAIGTWNSNYSGYVNGTVAFCW